MRKQWKKRGWKRCEKSKAKPIFKKEVKRRFLMCGNGLREFEKSMNGFAETFVKVFGKAFENTFGIKLHLEGQETK